MQHAAQMQQQQRAHRAGAQQAQPRHGMPMGAGARKRGVPV